MKVSNDDKILIGAGGLGVILLGFLYWKKKQVEKIDDLPTYTPEVEPVSTPKMTNTPVQGATLDRNKLLKVGSKGLEVRELQRLLGIAIDGAFGSKETLPALQKAKGVSEISLNAFAFKKKVATVLPIKASLPKSYPKKGQKLMAAKNDTAITNSKKLANGSYTNTGKRILGTFNYGDSLGTFVSVNINGYYLINMSGEFYFVKQDQVKTY
ncbi:peptidoglycan-binding protein [Flavobacterium sp. LB3P45]|uniref:Peptidoglycan-binding protein n=1 Tax=Flavobacterium fructosi TaxID=3230416 RepID=A0ABW6HJF4_9FLAO